jgi:hypothetical protein
MIKTLIFTLSPKFTTRDRVVSRFYVEKSHEDFPTLPANEFGDLVEAKDLINGGSTFTKTPLFFRQSDCIRSVEPGQ